MTKKERSVACLCLQNKLTPARFRKQKKTSSEGSQEENDQQENVENGDDINIEDVELGVNLECHHNEPRHPNDDKERTSPPDRIKCQMRGHEEQRRRLPSTKGLQQHRPLNQQIPHQQEDQHRPYRQRHQRSQYRNSRSHDQPAPPHPQQESPNDRGVKQAFSEPEIRLRCHDEEDDEDNQIARIDPQGRGYKRMAIVGKGIAI